MGAHTRIMPAHRREAIEGRIELHLQRAMALIARLDREDEPSMDREPDVDDEPDNSDAGVEDDPGGFDPEDDVCLAGDDAMIAGPVLHRALWLDDVERWRMEIGDAEDAEALGSFQVDYRGNA